MDSMDEYQLRGKVLEAVIPAIIETLVRKGVMTKDEIIREIEQQSDEFDQHQERFRKELKSRPWWKRAWNPAGI